jgi:transaldolase
MSDYFHRVAKQSPTRLWINNATPEQAQAALELGAVGATTNPTYAARVLREDSSATALLEQAVREADSDVEAVDRFFMAAVSRLQAVFLSLYEESGGTYGYVAIQGDPRVNDDTDAILDGAARYRALGENIIIKVPATPAGAGAMKELTSMNIPTIATLGFSVDQAVSMAETHREACETSGHSPPCYVTYIAGILDECLAEDAARLGQPVPPEWVDQAGCQGTRVAYRLYRQRGYRALLLGGGARATRHFTELVGGDLHVTIGWNLADELARADGEAEERIAAPIPDEMENGLAEHLPDYVKASRHGAMRPEEFIAFRPVAAFQQSFLDATEEMLGRVREARAQAEEVESGL